MNTLQQPPKQLWWQRLWRHRLLRWLRHWLIDERWARRFVPADMAKRIEQRISASEQRHSGEIVLVIEGGLPINDLWNRTPIRQRAQTLFATLGVWDTEHRNGVLIYLLLADHAIEVVADRGLARQVNDATWYAMIERLSQALGAQDAESGLTDVLAEISALQMHYFAHDVNAENPNELCNRIVYL